MSIIDHINKTARKVPTWPVYLIGALPPVWYFYLGLTGRLGVEPITAMEHKLGLLTLQVLIAGLLITPLRKYAGLNLIKFRRALGLIAFYLLGAHLLVWLVLDIGDPARIWADIVKRPYITIGMLSFLILVPLAATSYNAAIRKLGKRWRQLHMLVYPAVALGGVHFLLLRKGWQLEPIFYLLGIAAVLALRLPVKRWLAARQVQRPAS